MSHAGLSSIAVLISCCALVVVGIALLRIAWRGRRLDDHPICKSCKRDLFGLDANTLHCPECGRPIAGNIRIGNRARRPLLAGGATLLILLGVLLAGGMAAVRVSNIQWIQYTPTSWLIDRVGDTANTKRQDEAVAELGRRMKAAELSATQQSALFDALLALQKDTKIKWNTAWGDVLDRAYAAGDLSQAQRDSYHAHLFVPRIAIRPRVGQRGSLPVQSKDQFRTGNSISGGSQLVLRRRLRSVRVVDGPVLQDEGPRWGGYTGSGVSGGSGGSSTSYFDLQDKLAPGDYELELVHDFQLRSGWEEKATVLHEMSSTTVLPLSVLEDVSVDWADSMVTAEQMAARIRVGERSLTFASTQPPENAKHNVELRISSSGAVFYVNLHVDELPEDFGCAVVIEAGGKTFENSTVYFAKDANSGWHTSGSIFAADVAEKLIGQTATVRLIGSRSAAEKSIQLTKTWQGEVVLRDVKIEVDDSRAKN